MAPRKDDHPGRQKDELEVGQERAVILIPQLQRPFGWRDVLCVKELGIGAAIGEQPLLVTENDRPNTGQSRTDIIDARLDIVG